MSLQAKLVEGTVKSYEFLECPIRCNQSEVSDGARPKDLGASRRYSAVRNKRFRSWGVSRD